MKKLFFILIMSPLFCDLNAQEVGIRFGDMAGNNVAIDAVFSWKESRVHADISFGNAVGLDVIYDFVFKPVVEIEHLYYYMGVGLTTIIGDEFKFGAIGEVGVEYRFPNSPIVLGLDYKPAIIIIDETDFLWGNFGINARYIFNK
jgi:hypothetical protein